MIKSKKSTKENLKNFIQEPSEQDTSTTKPFLLLMVISIVIIAAAVLVFINPFQDGKEQTVPLAQTTSTQNQENEKTAINDIQSLIARVSQLIVIKPNEEPTVATVQDAELLRAGNPEFYKNAEEGDRLLVWSDKAVLYSTKMDKILNVLPISLPPAQPQPASTSTMDVTGSTTSASENIDAAPATTAIMAEEAAVIHVKNGTRIPGMARKMSDLLKQSDITAASLTDARLKTYEDTIIVNVSGKELPATLAALKKATGAQVSEAPAGETGLTGDIVVIVGTDFTP